MMSQTERFNYGFVEEMDAQFIELPYENDDFSMFIFLPNKISGLQKVRLYCIQYILLYSVYIY